MTEQKDPAKILGLDGKPLDPNKKKEPSPRMIRGFALNTNPVQEVMLPASQEIQEDFPIPLSVMLDGVGERSVIVHNQLEPTLFVSIATQPPTAHVKAIIYCTKTGEQLPDGVGHLGTVFIDGEAHHYTA